MPGLAQRAPQQVLSQDETAIIHALLYFDVFSHPLTLNELVEYCGQQGMTESKAARAVTSLREQGMIFRSGELYALSSEERIFSKRIAGNGEALRYMRVAKRLSALISLFPFVRAVMISGSLSKGFMDAASDIDFFIITEKDRLWISRSTLAAFRKLLPGRYKKFFCINYFIDNAGLEIPEKNLFTATEIAFIHPTYNAELYSRFVDANSWVSSQYYPNRHFHNGASVPSKNLFLPRIILEKILAGKIGNRIESGLHTFMVKRWEKKFRPALQKDEYELNFRTRKNASKHHAKGHQAKILSAYHERIAAFSQRHGITLAG